MKKQAVNPVTMPNSETTPETRMFRDQILTTADLREFKVELIGEIQRLLNQNGIQPVKKWMRSKEVRKLLNISPGTLQTLRVNGTITFSRIGGVIFYEYEEILKMVERNKTKGF
jgi:hypothetical protein